MKAMTMSSANGATRPIGPGSSTWTPSGTGHGIDNSTGKEPLVFMALIVNERKLANGV